MRIITIIFGVLLVVGGFYCMFAPVATYSALAWLIGLAMVAEGVASVITWKRRRDLGYANGWTLAGSIISIVLGVILLGSYAMQIALDAFIAYLIAIWLVVAGITRIVAAIAVRSSEGQEGAKGWIGQIVLGVLIVIVGILCIFNPLAIMAGVGMMLGISVVLVGIDLVVGGAVA